MAAAVRRPQAVKLDPVSIAATAMFAIEQRLTCGTAIVVPWLSLENRLFVLVACAVIAASAVSVRAQAAPPDLANATLEELMDIQVTSASRKSQRAEDVPAAIYVITGRDIRQSGLMTLPEILRLAPGVQVAQVSASKWAVSIRGFNSPFSNKLLVLIDGRSLYSRAFSGVFWDLNEVMVSDIDRIEIIRGPGGVAWGANAVNGVISIITRPASATGSGLRAERRHLRARRHWHPLRRNVRRGCLSCVLAVPLNRPTRGRRAGAPLGQLELVDQRRQDRLVARSQRVSGAGALHDKPYRAGWMALPSLVPGDAPVTDGLSHADEVSVLGRWTRTWTGGTELQVQAYHTTMRRDEPIIGFTESSTDFDGQYETRPAPATVSWWAADIGTSTCPSTTPSHVQMGSNRIETFNMFLQDEISVRRGRRPDARFEARVRHVRRLGRAAICPGDLGGVAVAQRVWAAASRTRRTPSNADRNVQLNVGVEPGPGLPILVATQGEPRFPLRTAGTNWRRGIVSGSDRRRPRNDGLQRVVRRSLDF